MPIDVKSINTIKATTKYDIINLYGVEQSWLKHLSVTNDNQVNVGLPHFYTGPSDLGRHSTLDTLSTFLSTQVACFASHMRLAKYARYMGLKIRNHTPGFYIDAYERALSEEDVQ